MRRFSWSVGLVVGLCWLGLASPALANVSTLSVLGNGTVFVTPNVADLSISVSRTGTHSAQALSAANRETNAIVGVIRGLGIPAKDIQTQNVNVYSFTKRVGHSKRHVRRWKAEESLGIHVTDIKLVGPVIDRATSAGASSVSGPSYSFSDPSAGIIAATRAAIADAKRRANDAAAAIGYHVTGVESMDLDPQGGVSGGYGSPVPHAPSGFTHHRAPTKIHPGKEEVAAQVAIVYTIAPG